MEIVTTPDYLSVWLIGDDSVRTQWDGLWPTAKSPPNTVVFTVNDVLTWWGTDFSVHPFAHHYADLLSYTKTTLLWGLPNLPCLLINSDRLASNTNLITVFKAVQVFTRLTISYRTWKHSKTKPHELRPYINQAFRVTLDSSNVALQQIEQLDKSHNAIASFKPHSKFRSNRSEGARFTNFNTNNEKPKNSFKRNHSKSRQNNKWKKGSTQKSSDNQKQKLCYTCGKPDHLARNCRLNTKNKGAN